MVLTRQRKIALFVLIAVVGWFVVGWPQYSPDSRSYTRMATFLAEIGDIALVRNGEIVSEGLWPPLFITIVMVFNALPIPLDTCIRLLNAVCWTSTLWLSAIILLRLKVRWLLIVPALFFIGFAGPVYFVHQWFWSEPLFIAMILYCLILFDDIRQGKPLILRVAVLSGLAILQRYVGVMLLPVAVFVLWRRPKALFGYMVIAVGPLAVWIGRNLIVTGTMAGVRYPSTRPFSFNLGIVLFHYAVWIGYFLALVGLVYGTYLLYHRFRLQRHADHLSDSQPVQ